MKSLKKIKAEMLKLNEAKGAGHMESDDYSREISKLELAMLERQARPRWKAIKASKKAQLPTPKKKGGK